MKRDRLGMKKRNNDGKERGRGLYLRINKARRLRFLKGVVNFIDCERVHVDTKVILVVVVVFLDVYNVKRAVRQNIVNTSSFN